MKIKLTEDQAERLLPNDQNPQVLPDDRIFHGGSSYSKFQQLKRQGYTPYTIIDGELQGLTKTISKIDHYSNPQTIYFLTDDEYNKAMSVSNKVKEIKQQREEQLKLINQMVGSYIQHNILKPNK